MKHENRLFIDTTKLSLSGGGLKYRHINIHIGTNIDTKG